jgi:hypothetical protein
MTTQSDGPFDLSTVKISNDKLDRSAISPVVTPADYPCQKCRDRGFIPRVYQEDCPECFGDDEYGQSVYCAECEFCCGC